MAEHETPRERARARRLGLNEAVFRAVNERLAGLAEELAPHGERLDLVCECGHVDCAERIRVEAAIYEQVRSDSMRFVVVPGHQLPDVEDVVEQRDGYLILRKHPGESERVARATDPRA